MQERSDGRQVRHDKQGFTRTNDVAWDGMVIRRSQSLLERGAYIYFLSVTRANDLDDVLRTPEPTRAEYR